MRGNTRQCSNVLSFLKATNIRKPKWESRSTYIIYVVRSELPDSYGIGG